MTTLEPQVPPLTSEEAFEKWVTNPHMLQKSTHPKVWRGSAYSIQEWEENPYETPWTRGAWKAWKHLWKTP